MGHFVQAQISSVFFQIPFNKMLPSKDDGLGLRIYFSLVELLVAAAEKFFRIDQDVLKLAEVNPREAKGELNSGG